MRMREFRSQKKNYEFQSVGMSHSRTFTSHQGMAANQYIGFVIRAATKIVSRYYNSTRKTLKEAEGSIFGSAICATPKLECLGELDHNRT